MRPSVHVASLSIILLAALCTGAGRCATKPVPTSRSPEQASTTAPGPSSSASAQGGSQGCPSGGAPAIVLGRLMITARGAPVSWVDVEVHGAEQDAMRACSALVRREVETVYPKQTGLSERLMRPCSTTALAEPDSPEPYLLVDRRELSPADLALASADPACPTDTGHPVGATVRRVGGYPDKKACDDALAKLAAAGVESQADARESARKWLDDTIAEQQKRAEEVCRGAKEAEACRRQEAVLRVLQERRSGPEEPMKRPGVTQLCRAR